MKKLMLPFAALALSLFAVSCAKEDSSDVNQDKIYTDYEIYYNQNDDKTRVIARFRFGGATGTILELSDGSGASVTFNGDAMPYNALAAGHYKEYAGKVASGTFLYTNTEGTSFSNATPTMDTIAWPTDFDTLVKSQANTLTWTGNALAANERVDLFFGAGTWAWGDDALLFQGLQGATDIVIGTNQINQLNPGQVTGYMDRVNAVNVTNGTSEGGRIRSRYKATNQTIQVVN